MRLYKLKEIITKIQKSVFDCLLVRLVGILHLTWYLVKVTLCQEGERNQYIQLVKVLYSKLMANGKQLSAFPT